MSTSEFLRPPAGDDPWRQNEGLIRRLYQDERKTLEEVKHIMETGYKFPQIPLSSWETKLRDVLGLRKKLKRNDWPIIYSHFLPRRVQGKQTAIYLNGTRIEWRRAWKEMRRCGIISRSTQSAQLPLAPLPPGVVVRTPSPPAQPVPVNNAPLPRSLHAVAKTKAVAFKDASLDPQCTSTLIQPASLGRFPPCPESSLALRTYADSVFRLCLEGTPFIQVVRDLAATTGMNTASAFGGQWPAILSQHCHIFDLTLHRSHSDLNGGLGLAVALSRLTLEMSNNFDVHHKIAMVVYSLSNDSHKVYPHGSDTIWDILEFLFARTPRTTLTTFWRGDFPSMRAAWETLTERLWNAPRSNRLKDPFRYLMTFGVYNDWIDSSRMGNDYLYYAAYMDCVDIVQLLLAKGCRPDSQVLRPIMYGKRYVSAIVAALNNRNLKCARLLIEHCDVNRVMQNRLYRANEILMTNFSVFIEAYRNDDKIYSQALKLFLKSDADVDARFPHPFEYLDYPWDQFCLKNDMPKERQISILEFCFYYNRPLFKRLRPHSKARPLQMTRTGIFCALELGSNSLRDYLEGVCHADANSMEQYLQFFLAEQMLIGSYFFGEVSMDPHVTLALLGLEVAPTLSLLRDPPDMVCGVTRQIYLAEDDDAKQLWMSVLEQLLGNGASLGTEALETAVQYRNISLLQYFISCTANIADEGHKALATAANRDDFEAVELFLQAGVDINAFVQRDEESLTILAFAISTQRTYLRGHVASYRMMKYLIERGAKPMAYSDDWHPCHFLQFILQNTATGLETAPKVQYIVDKFIDFRHPSTPSDGLLEACLWGTMHFSDEDSQERLTTFEYLFQKGAKLCPGASLATLICRGGGKQQCQDLIRAGADIHAYSFSGWTEHFIPNGISPVQAAALRGEECLLQQLLEMGAQVDGKPFPRDSATALQCICHWNPVTSEENLRRLRIIQLLLDHGAEVNASPGGRMGYTALQQAAEGGALDVATLLLRHGANINDAAKDGRYALDVAASWGRLDMVQFLLNANAVSCQPGHTGYNGAIEAALQSYHFAVAELIKKHAENNLKWGIVNPFLSCGQKPRRDDLIYKSGSDLEVISTD